MDNENSLPSLSYHFGSKMWRKQST